jgi:hypothetical protein
MHTWYRVRMPGTGGEGAYATVQIDWRRLPSCRPWDEALHGNLVRWTANFILQGGYSTQEDEKSDEGQLAQLSKRQPHFFFFGASKCCLFLSVSHILGVIITVSVSVRLGMHASAILLRAGALHRRSAGLGLETGSWACWLLLLCWATLSL